MAYKKRPYHRKAANNPQPQPTQQQAQERPQVILPPPTSPNIQAGVTAMVEQGLRVVRIENETQQLLAIQRPRDEARIMEKSMQELQLSPDFAKTAFYSIPYKNEWGGITLVEGPSIKAAMALARRWGNNANGARVVDDLEDRITVEGVFIDYETNIRTLRTVSVPKRTWSKKFQRFVGLRPDRLNLAIQAAMSKATRNAVLATLPAALVTSYFNKAKGLASLDAGKRKEVIAAELMSELQWRGASKEQVTKYVEKPEVKGKKVDDLIGHLQGIVNALDDGQTTLEELFGTTAPAQQEKIEGPASSGIFESGQERSGEL